MLYKVGDRVIYNNYLGIVYDVLSNDHPLHGTNYAIQINEGDSAWVTIVSDSEIKLSTLDYIKRIKNEV